MMTHDEASDLLAAFSLDAVGSAEYVLITEHLAICPRCQAEVDAHHEVAAALGNSIALLPEDLWRTISSRLNTRDDDLLASVTRRVVPPDDAEVQPGWRRIVRSSRGRMITAASVAVASAAVATVLGLSLANADNRVAQLQGAIGEAAHTEVVAALETRGHHIINLTDARHRDLAQFVVLPNGRGYLVTSRLPTLSSGRTYQLWGIVNGETISLGLLGRTPHLATFTAAGSLRPDSLGVTVEAAGGSRQPSGPMLASGIA